jgi:hypothetical protein
LPLERIRTNGDFINANLQEATRINGFPCNKGWVQFTKSGRLLTCLTAEDIVFQDNLIPKGTDVLLNEELEITHLIDYFSEDMEIQGFQVSAKSKRLGGTVSTYTTFYPNGRLRQFFSPSNVTIDGIPCRRLNSGWMTMGLPKVSNPLRIDTSIALHEDGKVKYCTLSSDAEIGGRSLSAGSEIRVSEDGEVTILDDSPARRMKLRIANLFD